MAESFASLRNLRFLLYEVLDAASLCALPRFSDHDAETFDLVLDAERTGKGRAVPAVQADGRRAAPV